jgi:hypothetical protein
MGFGALNIFCPVGTENGPAIWTAGQIGRNTGSTANIRDLFPNRSTTVPFRVEFGPQMIAPFLIPTNNTFNVPVNATAIPEPGTLALSGIAVVGLMLRKRWRR